ncbi:MAG: SRPBCC domain-containing protein [Actinobacteria bacterium]|nr:SRPBCC domain-containing protein [Actinomycetota bacterium]
MTPTEATPITRWVEIPASRRDVWRALTTPDLLAAWLGEVLELEPEVGGSVIVRQPDGSIRRGLVELAEPGRALVFRWRRLAGVGPTLEVGDATRVGFALEDSGAGTRLVVTEEPAPLVADRGDR